MDGLAAKHFLFAHRITLHVLLFFMVICPLTLFIHSFIICLLRKHSPYKNCANYAQIIKIDIKKKMIKNKNTVLYTVQ